MSEQSFKDMPLTAHELQQLRFRLELTPADRLALSEAMANELVLKRSLARQMAGKPTPAELAGPDDPVDHAEWLRNGRRLDPDWRQRAFGLSS